MGQSKEAPKVTLERAQKALRAGCEPTWAHLSRRLNIPRNTLRDRMRRLGINAVGEILGGSGEPTEDGDNDGGDYLETIKHYENGEISSDRLITIFAEEAKDPDALLKAHGFDPEQWDLAGAVIVGGAIYH